ncbi:MULTISPECIES: hypothetical protein [unclassified Paenibacillus]|uniref:hypothetical protein n=1 Tax=unclassified Paenibacillus TaxID=185978 RepID=UPI0036267773
MRIVKIDYDLNGKDETSFDYRLLKHEIHKMGTVAKGLFSSYYVQTSLNDNQIFIMLQSVVDQNDAFEITNVNKVPKNQNLSIEAINLIRKTLYPDLYNSHNVLMPRSKLNANIAPLGLARKSTNSLPNQSALSPFKRS